MPNADILSSLFVEPCDNNSTAAQVVDGSEHSVSLFFLPGNLLQWRLQSASVCNDKLMIIAKKNHYSFLKIYQSSSTSQFREYQLPAFSNCGLFQHEVGSCSVPSKQLLSTGVEYRPVLSLLSCLSSKTSDTSLFSVASPTTDVFFRQLFGFELSLGQSPVVLIGSQSGAVMFHDIRGYSNATSSTGSVASLSNTLCNVNQPIFGIHTLRLPIHPEHQGSDDSSANALLVVGMLGKLVLFTEVDKQRHVPFVSELSVPGPILSSFLVKNHSFAYCNTRGIYRVCLEPSCLLKSVGSDTTFTNLVVVPRFQFHSPHFVSPAIMSFITGASSPSVNQACSITAVSINGQLFQFQLESCQQTIKPTATLEVGREMKDSMNSIKNTDQQTVEVQSQLKLVDTALTELNQALSIIHSIQSSTSRVFSCTVSPVTERVGVRHMSMSADLELCYAGVDKLQRGWALLVTVQCTTSRQSKFTTLSLAGLGPNDSLKHRMKLELENGMPASFSVTATLCYRPTHLHSVISQLSSFTQPKTPFYLLKSTGVSFMLVSAVFHALDFLQPCSDSSLHTSAPISSHGPHTEQHHSFDMVLPNPGVEVSSGSSVVAQSSRGALDMFLPPTVTNSLSINNNGQCQTLQCSYNGSILLFEVKNEGEKCLVKITSTGNVKTMVEIISSICCRCQNEGKVSSPTEVTAFLRVCVCFVFVFRFYCPIFYSVTG